MTKNPVHLEFMTLIGPMIIGLFAVLSFNVADMYFISKLSVESLAAFTLSIPVFMLLTNVSTALGQGINALSSYEYGKKNKAKAKDIAISGIFLSTIIGIVLCVIVLLIDRKYFQLLTNDKKTVEEGVNFIFYMAISFPFFIFQLVISSISRSFGNGKIPAKLMVISSVINIILDPIFIFGIGPFSGLGIEGASLASLASRAFCAYLSFRFLIELGFDFKNIKPLSLYFSHSKSIIFQSWPAMIAQLNYPISALILSYFISQYGSEASAAYGIANKVESLLLVGMMALSSSVGPFVGQNRGANEPKRVILGIKFSILFCLAWGTLTGVFFYAFSEQIARVFTDSPIVASILVTYCSIVPLSYFADGMTRVASSTFVAMRQRSYAPKINMLRSIIIFVPACLLFEPIFGLQGVFLAMSSTWLLTALISIYLMKTKIDILKNTSQY